MAPLVGLDYILLSLKKGVLKCCRRRDRRQATVHRTVAFTWVRANVEHKKEATPNGVASFLAPLLTLDTTTLTPKIILKI